VWIVKLALDRPYTFIILALLILIMSPVTIMRTPTDIFPYINSPVITVADSIGVVRYGRVQLAPVRVGQDSLAQKSGSQRQSSCAFKELVMATNRNQSSWNVEDLTDAEISGAIHYLDPDSSSENGAGSDNDTRGICLILMIFFFECAAVVLLFHCTS
jgi:hypothetical protein